jgi:hypothetical protein
MKSLKPRTLQVSPWNFGWKTSVWRRDPCTLEGYGSIPIAIMWVKQCHKPPMWEWFIPPIKMVICGMVYDCFSHISSYIEIYNMMGTCRDDYQLLYDGYIREYRNRNIWYLEIYRNYSWLYNYHIIIAVRIVTV